MQDAIRRIKQQFLTIRHYSEALCEPLEIEDYVVQPCLEVSPIKWHLAHTTWFFEELILKPHLPNYTVFNDTYHLLFNSYYKALGKHWLQTERGHVSRPTVAEVYAYRAYVDDNLCRLLDNENNEQDIINLIVAGLQHEQQHQELLLMDIKAVLAVNPEVIAYHRSRPILPRPTQVDWVTFNEGLYQIGYAGNTFCFDNEMPRHTHYVPDFSVRKQVVTNHEFLNFINDGGYANPLLWLSQGWDWVTKEGIQHPRYWRNVHDQWHEFTLYGEHALALDAPVVHVSYFEADAFATWAGERLLTEQEYEIYLSTSDAEAFLDVSQTVFHPYDASAAFNQVWSWTSSPYVAYRGYRPFDGAMKEYNGKFMCNQFVLRGGCVATPKDHIRATYRNFYLPHQQWMFSGIRLGRDNT